MDPAPGPLPARARCGAGRWLAWSHQDGLLGPRPDQINDCPVSLRLFSAPRPAWVRRTVHQADGTYDKLHAPSGRSAGPFAARPATAITVRREVRVRYGFRHRPAQAAA